MNTGNRGGTDRGKLKALAACAAAAALASACAVYQVKELDGKAVAAKPPKGKIVSVTTAEKRVDFAYKDPARVKDRAIVGSIHASLALDPFDIADMTTADKLVRVVCRDGLRFVVLSSMKGPDKVLCHAAFPQYIPLEDVVSVKLKSVNTAASILSSLGGAVLLVGALALDGAVYGEDSEVDPGDTLSGSLVSAMVDSWKDPSPSPGGRVKGGRSTGYLMALKNETNVAEETEFWVLEWTPVSPAPDGDGKYRVPIVNATGVPRGVDEAKLVVVDHPPGLTVGPDVEGHIRGISVLVPPLSATEGDGFDIMSLVRDKDDAFWRSRGGDPEAGAPARPRDEIILEFPRPKGAREALLVVNAANTAWPPRFAIEARERDKARAADGQAGPAYKDWEYMKLKVGVLTGFGWQTGQVIFAGGPLPAGDMAYRITLDDVVGDKIRLKLSPPAGYWLIDRVALEFDDLGYFDCDVVDAEGEADPEIVEVLRALAVEDGSTVFLEAPGQQTVVTFPSPPFKEGMERTVFLRTVSCYEMTGHDRSAPSRRPGPPAR
jgi:hypothetical protein